MTLPLRILPVQPRHAPYVLRVVADFQPFLPDEDRARARLLGLRIIRDAYAVQIEVILARGGEKADIVVHRGKLARAPPHARYPPVPDDLVDHQQARLQGAEDLRRLAAGGK